jgi:hypothetical protein
MFQEYMNNVRRRKNNKMQSIVTFMYLWFTLFLYALIVTKLLLGR